MKKIYLSGNYITVIYDGVNERLYPKAKVQLSEFVDHFLIENRIDNQPKDTQVSFASIGTWFNEAGDTAYTVESLRNLFIGLAPDNIPAGDLSNANENDALLADANGQFNAVPLNAIIGQATFQTQGYYGLLSPFYFGGDATETVVGENDTNQWMDVELSVDVAGLFDMRPTSMKEAQSDGHTGDGSDGSPILFTLEGLDINSFANFRASMAFFPDEDEGQLESRLLFNRHSGTTPSEDFSIEEVTLSMQNGADKDYVAEPLLTFFVGDTIDTNGVGDAGKCRFQIKSNVTGTVKLRALTWYINK